MGYHIAYAAFRNIEKNSLLSQLNLAETNVADEYNESPISGCAGSDDWYVIWSNDLEWGLNEDKFAQLSENCEALVSIAEETSMTFLSSGFSGGRKTWSVFHNGQDSIEHLQTDGVLPASFSEILKRNKALQEADKENDLYSVDHYANIPPEVFASVCGFKYDEASDAIGRDRFVVLEQG